MRFGAIAPERAEGAVLAHSLRLPGGVLKKGRVLDAGDVAAIIAAGIAAITVARPGPGDIGEDAAAERVAAPLATADLVPSPAFAGRVNLVARRAGLLRVDAAAVAALNAVDEGVTLATLADHAWVGEGALVATIKVIPYAVPETVVGQAERLAAAADVLRLHPAVIEAADLVLTQVPDMKPSLIEKARAVTEARLAACGVGLASVQVVAHETAAVAAALGRCRAGMVLIFGASATSDRADVAPAGLLAAGGRLERFGMPVDPGNLLFLGALADRPVVGLPGCARSPALNGADWVLERLIAGQQVTGADIAGMGVGGLLKEIPQRRQPRTARPVGKDRVEILLLAAGASRRMAGEDKLLRPVGGRPLLRHAAEAALASRADLLRVMLPPGAEGRRAALAGLDLEITEVPDWHEGMAAALRAGMRARSARTGAVVVALADMPGIGPAHYDALIAAYDPEAGREICRAATEDGKPGNPVLFGQRFFEPLADVSGDAGARSLIAQAAEHVVLVPTPGQGARIDLDTPEAWQEWERGAGG